MSEIGPVLERNVARLLLQSYSPSVPREDFRELLVVRARAAVGARTRTAEGGTWPAFRSAWSAGLAVAAAAAVLFCTWLWTGPEVAEDRASILARGEVAVRESGHWRGLAPRAGRAELSLAREAEIATPERASALVEVAAGATLVIEPDAHTSLVRGADGGLAIELARGVLALERGPADATGATGPAWHVGLPEWSAARPRDRVRFVHGALALEREEPGPCLALTLERGEAWALVRGEPLALAAGRTRWCEGAPVAASTASRVDQPEDRAPREALGVAPADPASAAGAADPAAGALRAQLSGSVRSRESGAPIASFYVALVPELVLPRPSPPIVRSIEDPAGRFALDDLPAGEYTLWIGAIGRAPYVGVERVAIGAEPHALDVELEQGMELAGRVVDGDSGEPIAGVLVISENDLPTNMVTLSGEPVVGAWHPFAHTDAQGRFALAHLRSSAAVLRATHPGWAPTWREARAGAGETTIVLGRGARLAGRVENPRGEPVASVQLVVVPMDPGDKPLFWAEPTSTDARGEYTIDDLPPHQCVVVRLGITGRPETWMSPEVRFVDLVAKEEHRADFLGRASGVRLFGKVTTESGEPVAGRGLSVMPVGSDVSNMQSNWRATTTGHDGAYEFSGLAPGRYELYSSGVLPMEVIYQREVALEDVTELQHDLVVHSGALSGRALDARSGAPASAIVLIVDRRVGTEWRFAGKVLARPDGGFDVPYLPDGEYRVTALPQAGGLGAGRVEGLHIAAGAHIADVELRLWEGARLAIAVRDASGAPVVDAEIELFDAAGEELEMRQFQRTDVQGRIEFGGLPPGRVRVQVQAAGFSAAVDEVQLAPDSSEELTIELTRP